MNKPVKKAAKALGAKEADVGFATANTLRLSPSKRQFTLNAGEQ